MSALSRLGLVAASTLPTLAGCGSAADQFAPACPRPAILRDANDITRFRGERHDFLDTALTGRVTSISGDCKRASSRSVTATVSVGMELTRGPAAAGRLADIAYFVAVSQGDRVLDKQVFTLRAEFPENTDRVRLSGDSVDLALPVEPGTGAESYQVTVGFQLTPQELAYNRERLATRR